MTTKKAVAPATSTKPAKTSTVAKSKAKPEAAKPEAEAPVEVITRYAQRPPAPRPFLSVLDRLKSAEDAKPEAAKPEAAKPEDAKPEAAQEAPKVKPEAAKPEAAKPEAAQEAPKVKPETKARRVAASEETHEVIAKAAQKMGAAGLPPEAAKPEAAPSGDFHDVLVKNGFVYAKTETVGKYVAWGYTHPKDKRAVMVTTGPKGDQAWMLKSFDGSETGGSILMSLIDSLYASRTAYLAQTAGKKRVGFAAKTGEADAVTLPPQNVVRAVEMLGGMTLHRYDIHTLSGDGNYTKRVQLLKKLLGVDKILVKESGVNHLVDTFYSAVGVGEGTLAAKRDAFAQRCRAIGVAARQLAAKAKQEEASIIKAALAVPGAKTFVPGKILDAPKKKNKKQRMDELAATARELYVASLMGEETMQPNAHPYERLSPGIAARDLRLVERKGMDDFTALRLEAANSQGAIHLYDTGAHITLGVIPPALADEFVVRKPAAALADIEAFLTTLEASSTERSDEVKKVLKAVRRAVDLKTKPLTLAAAVSKKVKAPRDAAAEITLIPGDVGLLEDPRLGVVMMQLEKENSQGAICVYNNGSRVSVGVVPPEILKTLRPVQEEVDLIKAANQLLNPLVPSVPVTPGAHRHLTAVINCKELVTMATKKFEAPAKSTKATAVKSTDAVAVKSTDAVAVKTAAKKTAATKEPKAPRASSYADKKIKVLSKDMSALREGTKRYIGVEIILKSKTTNDAIPALAKAGCDNSWLAFTIANGYIELV